MSEDINRKDMFCCIISRHLSGSRISFINKVWTLSRRMNEDSLKNMHLIVDKEVKKHKDETLAELYRMILNQDMCQHFPDLCDIMELRLSDLNKCVLLMSILGFTPCEIADLLLSTTHSIKTIMLNIRKKYPVYEEPLTKYNL